MDSLFLQQIANGLITGSIYSLIAIGLTMIFGVMKISNFAHGDFSMVGAYVAVPVMAMLAGAFGWTVALILAAAVVGLMGYALERVLFRPLMSRWTDADTIMASLALSLVLGNAMQLFCGATPRMIPDPFGNATMAMGPVSTSVLRVFCLGFSCLTIGLLQVFLNRTSLGAAIRATSQNRAGALLVGINIGRICSVTFVLGSALAGIGGVLYGTLFAVYPFMGVVPTLKAFTVTILGGMGNIRGAIFGGFILGVAEALGGNYVSMEYKNAIGFIIIILVLLIIPRGLFGSSGK